MAPARASGRGRGRGRDVRVLPKDTTAEASLNKEKDLTPQDILKTFSTQFLHLSGILFTHTSLETFGDVFASVVHDLCALLASGPKEELNFGSNHEENGVMIVRLVAILIFSVHNVKRESEDLSYAELLQRSLLLQLAFTAAFEFTGHLLARCLQLGDVSTNYLLPGILVFIEWLACNLDSASGDEGDDKQAMARSFYWKQFVSLLNKLQSDGLIPIDCDEDVCFSGTNGYEGDVGDRLALWEDFELRGFSPLAPAHVILQFSDKHPRGIDSNGKEKKARIQRILAARKALMSIVEVTARKDVLLAAETIGGSQNVLDVAHTMMDSVSIEKDGNSSVVQAKSIETIELVDQRAELQKNATKTKKKKKSSRKHEYEGTN